MFPFICFYKGKRFEVYAATVFAAQNVAVQHFKARKPWDVTVMRADVVHTPDF